MASETGPDLTDARLAIEELMVDACTVLSDAEGAGDDVLNEETGKLEPPEPGDADPLYGADTQGDGGRSLADEEGLGGKCMLSRASQTDIASIANEGGAQVGLDTYRLTLPWDAPELPDGAVAKMQSCRWDPLLVDKDLRVRRATYKSLLVSRRYLVELRS